MNIFDKLIKIGVTFPKSKVKLPKNWPNIKSSIYNNEKNFAILTGKINDIIVIDLDNKDPEFKAKMWFEDNIGKLESINTLVTKTINDGYHIYFKYNSKIENRNNFKDMNIDILSDKKCCYQGEHYDIIYNNEIRELTEDEIKKISESLIKPKNDIKDIVLYKDANKLLNIPITTEWNIIKSEKGHKVVPKCKECLVNPCKKHSQEEHSSLFINNDKSVIKSCFSCGVEIMNKKESKKIMTVFLNVSTQEESVYQELTSDLIDIAKENKYKREKGTGIVYKKVRSYAYQRYLEPMDFLNDIFLRNKTFKSNVNNMDNLIKFMKQYNDPDFPFMEYNKNYLGFSNGVLNTEICEFINESELEKYNLTHIMVRKYFDKEFTYSTETPLMDKILDYQFDSDVRDFIYACLGRMFDIRDNYGFMLYLLGEPGCGKSLILDVLCECFNSIGAIGDTFEEKFGLSFLYDKDIIVCDDLPKNISKIFPQQTFQTIITGGKIPIAVKGGSGFSVDWNVPLLWCGNWFPDYIDKGQISRRMLVANFQKMIRNPDPSLKKRIILNELVAFIYKCLLYYKNLREQGDNRDIWDVCPKYFLDQREELKMERNPLFKFLIDNTRYKDGNVLLLEEVRERFNNWLGKKVKTLDNGTFFQVNNEYIINNMKICIHCEKHHKKGCCEKYNRVDRSSRKVVKNIEFN